MSPAVLRVSNQTFVTALELNDGDMGNDWGVPLTENGAFFNVHKLGRSFGLTRLLQHDRDLVVGILSSSG